MGYHQASYDEPLIKDIHSGTDYKVPAVQDKIEDLIPASLLRKKIDLPDVAEFDVVRHYTRLSQMNFSVDIGTYPLGSCTMKFNPHDCIEISAVVVKQRSGSMNHLRNLNYVSVKNSKCVWISDHECSRTF